MVRTSSTVPRGVRTTGSSSFEQGPCGRSLIRGHRHSVDEAGGSARRHASCQSGVPAGQQDAAVRGPQQAISVESSRWWSQSGERRTVIEGGALPLYATSGHLVFVRAGELLAAPFDPDRLEVIGTAAQAIEKLPSQLQGIPSIDISASGTVIYAPTAAVSRLVSRVASGCRAAAE